jgi:sugar/nucleoside kinase (ribokinase family)
VRTLCLGEALVDMICERHVTGLDEADSFVPHFGGATANVAVMAARAGGGVALAGGAGDDAWGAWLRDRLSESGVELTWFELMRGQHTPVAFVTIDGAGDASYQVYGDAISLALDAVADHLPAAVEACDALFFSSNTLVAERERAVTMDARERALKLRRPVVFDPNVRLNRWPSPSDAAAAASACVRGAKLMRCNREEAELLTGESDPEAGARALVAAGAELVVLTLGADGAILRGALEADAAGVPARVVSTVGAGDAVMGVLLARLSQAGYYAPAVAAALPEAMAEGARACERWGAV